MSGNITMRRFSSQHRKNLVLQYCSIPRSDAHWIVAETRAHICRQDGRSLRSSAFYYYWSPRFFFSFFFVAAPTYAASFTSHALLFPRIVPCLANFLGLQSGLTKDKAP
ncbi:hypothetical protein VTH06DRAFT_7481 [Thermothelomyces fergusii]